MVVLFSKVPNNKRLQLDFGCMDKFNRNCYIETLKCELMAWC